ncbi:response regulator [Insolitispirillum peregrinum]|uniref:Two-component system, OmpR family, phosphate regulon response regulator OmpR n=1 Tax=Insolitispirillum peregrinum TaxID=80876 RepID=A0A1N7MVD7_9PROT|nr:response regulator transcription factor [Insolitispirillum peregrinum]SIS90095.1 two-component system, OmpR family, phosphate regulon response regulator OmpR [Insolitispirillum peregrinum]
MSAVLPEEQPHILVVDDDRRLRDLLRRFLSENGFTVSTAADAAEARAHLAGMCFDALVVDVMMPGESGLELTRSLRDSNGPPVLMLTAHGDPQDRIAGLESGADDYLAKPFEPRELVLRLRSILRRLATPAPALAALAVGSVRMGSSLFDLGRQELRTNGEPVYLTTAEAQLLMVLASNAGQPFTREDLADATGMTGNPRTVDVQVTRLRKKLEDDPRQPRYLQTVRGTGYVLRPGG